MQVVSDKADYVKEYLEKHKVQFSLTDLPVMNEFVGRHFEIQKLEECFYPHESASKKRKHEEFLGEHESNSKKRKIYVIHGLGGIGKTQLAANFARNHYHKHSAVFWLDGSSEDILNQSLADIAPRLPQDELTPAIKLQLEQPDFKGIAQGVLQWLSLPSNKHWLLIFDNVDRDNNLKEPDPLAYDIKAYFPSSDHGSIIITTRLAYLWRHGSDLKLDIVNDEEAIDILEKTSNRQIRGRWR
jgi:hypothetical protein